MKYLHLFLVVGVCIAEVSCNLPESGRKTPSVNNPYENTTATPEWYKPDRIDTLRIATWNVQHFVDPYDSPYIENRREDIPPSDMGNRRDLFARAVKNLDADIVVLQEFESDRYLRFLAEHYFPEMGYEVFAALESSDWYMNVVMMSRIPLGTFYSYAHINTPIVGQTDSLGNPESQTFINNRMWSVDVLVHPRYRFTLTGLHLKAGRGKRNEGWRLGQIRLLRSQLDWILEHDPDRNVLIAGDLNTTPGSNDFKALLGEETGMRFRDPLEGKKVYTHPSDSVFWRIDHILPNTNMFPELVPNSVAVAEPLSDEEMIVISDHLPLIALFVAEDQ